MIQEGFDRWAIVELYGHGRLAGRVTSDQIGGASFVRVDVPEIPPDLVTEAVPGFTKFYGPGAIFAITPVDEATARQAVAEFREQPVQKWCLPVQKKLVPVTSEVDGWESAATGEHEYVEDAESEEE